MSERSYRFSEDTEARIKEVQTKIQNVLDLPELPTEHFAIAAIMSLGLGVISNSTQYANKNNPMQYSHPNNFHDFVSRLREMYLAQRPDGAEMGNRGA